MKALFLVLLLLLPPLRQQVRVEVLIPADITLTLSDFENNNFKQEIAAAADGILVRIKSQNFLDLGINNPLTVDQRFLAQVEEPIRDLFLRLFDKGHFLKDFLINVSLYLENEIQYTLEDLPQDPRSVVLNRRGHCIGLANLVQTLLSCAGVNSRLVKGFYLDERGDEMIPVSHRWLEIYLGEKIRFFYDPQFQFLISKYILVDDSVRFDQVERFSGQLLKKSRRIIDE